MSHRRNYGILKFRHLASLSYIIHNIISLITPCSFKNEVDSWIFAWMFFCIWSADGVGTSQVTSTPSPFWFCAVTHTVYTDSTCHADFRPTCLSQLLNTSKQAYSTASEFPSHNIVACVMEGPTHITLGMVGVLSTITSSSSDGGYEK